MKTKFKMKNKWEYNLKFKLNGKIEKKKQINKKDPKQKIKIKKLMIKFEKNNNSQIIKNKSKMRG